MTLSFRPDMKTIVHEIDGHPVTVMGKSIDGGGSALRAMLEADDEAERFRAGAKVRCSYVDPSGVHEFTSVVASAEALALNHRLVRVTIDPPADSERHQRRQHVRAAIELPVLVEDSHHEQYACTSVDLSAGGIAVTWPPDVDMVTTGAMVEIRFRSERFEHHHIAQVLEPYQRGKTMVVRFRFEGITSSARDRLATVVAAAQRMQLQRQRDGG